MKDKLIKKLPNRPGVYFFKKGKEILYIGKATSLRNRVKSYFSKDPEGKSTSYGAGLIETRGPLIVKMVQEANNIDWQETDSVLEALILEAKLIRQHTPPFNVREKDDKSFLCVEFTRERFPRVLLVRARDASRGERFGPFTSAQSIREALRILRRIFPYSTHPPEKISGPNPRSRPRGCFEYEIGLCPGTCVGAINAADYRRNVRHLRMFFRGQKKMLLRTLAKEMRAAAKVTEFERAEKIRRQIFALRHIQDVALIGEEQIAMRKSPKREPRIEGYDISNISGTSAVGAMVVFQGSRPTKAEYRRFRIRTVAGVNDTGMLAEILKRRFGRNSEAAPSESNWALPQLILIDGGVGQVNAARQVVAEAGYRIPVVGIAKGPDRKKNEVIGRIPAGFDIKTLVAVRDEAHRFAMNYHRKVRARRIFE